MNENQSAGIRPAGGVLEPISLEQFFSEFWEQKPLHIARSSANPFDTLITVTGIEDLLSTQSLAFPTVQLSHAGQSIPVSDYTDNNERIVSTRIIERYKAGSTIVISHAHRLVSNLMSLCRDVESSLMMRCQTNVYLSPAANQGFNPHFDTHDVFILQVSGKKTFNFYSSGASFPTSADRFNSEIHDIGEKTEEIVLSAGDTLYIPRGFVHDAVADKDNPSLHVTLGVYPVLMHELINEVLQVARETQPEIRRAISQNAWMRQEGTQSTTQLIKDVLQAHFSEDAVSEALNRLRDEFALERIQDCGGTLTGGAAQTLRPDSKLVVNQRKVLDVERAENRLILRVFGQVLEFSDAHADAVDWLLQRDSAQLKSIPGIESEQKHALVEQLSAAGVVTVQACNGA